VVSLCGKVAANWHCVVFRLRWKVIEVIDQTFDEIFFSPRPQPATEREYDKAFKYLRTHDRGDMIRGILCDRLAFLQPNELAVAEAELEREFIRAVPIFLEEERDPLNIPGWPCLKEEADCLDLLLAHVGLANATVKGAAGTGGKTNTTVSKATAEKNRPRISRDEANIRAREALKNPKVSSVRKLAKAIGCSDGLASTLPAWTARQEELRRRGKKNGSVPKAVGLTEGVLANKGQDDPELERLIAEHQADYEESPLVSHARKYRRRPKA
jgi:hypothetical protein